MPLRGEAAEEKSRFLFSRFGELLLQFVNSLPGCIHSAFLDIHADELLPKGEGGDVR